MEQRPESNEYDPYFERYIKLVPDGDLLHILESQLEETHRLFGNLSETQGNYRYAPDKWSVKEVLGHIADTERVMSYRLLRIARGDTTPLPGFDQDLFINGAAFGRLSVSDILNDYTAVRQSTLSLLKGLTEEAWLRLGTVLDHITSARSLACIIAGHELHHRRVIEERYGIEF